jgi:hypothetical protein
MVMDLFDNDPRVSEQSAHARPVFLERERGPYKTVKAGFRPWLCGKDA